MPGADDINNEDNLIYFFIGHCRPPGPITHHQQLMLGPHWPGPLSHKYRVWPPYHYGQVMQSGGEAATNTFLRHRMLSRESSRDLDAGGLKCCQESQDGIPMADYLIDDM